MRRLALLCLGGCAAPPPEPSAITPEAVHDDSGGPAVDSASEPPAESVGSPEPPWVEIEDLTDLEALPPRTEQLCQLALDCEGTPSEATKIPCTFRVEGGDGVVDYDGAAVAWYRGRSTSRVPKHQFGVELRDPYDLPRSVNLLGMGGESDWVVNGLYYDRLLIRNKLGFDLFQSFGGEERYAPETALCELTLNGEYAGAYALSERIKRDDDRVNITKDDGTGGTFVMKQNDEGCFYWNTATYGCWKLLSPNDDDLSEEAAAWLTDYLAAWEAAATGADPDDEETGVLAYADIDSFVDIVIIEELFKNEDAWYTSMHIWRDRDGKIHFTPWDLDMTFGQFPYYPWGDYANPERWITYRPPLIMAMLNSPAFQARIGPRWAELRAAQLSEEAIYARMDTLQGILGEAIDRNFALWPIESINYGGWFYEVSSYADEDAYVRDWIHARLTWMDAQILGE